MTVFREAKNYSFLTAIAVSILDTVLYSKYVCIYIYIVFSQQSFLIKIQFVTAVYVNKDIVLIAKYVLLEI
jgi:hypothetical protein